jgi:hypothetical protein
MLTLNNLQKLPHENHRKKPRFQTIVVQMIGAADSGQET